MSKKKNKVMTEVPSVDTGNATPAQENTTVIREMDTRIGLVNRKNFALTVMMKKDSFVLSAAGRTGKDYKEKDILSVNGKPLQQAVAMGMCSIMR